MAQFGLQKKTLNDHSTPIIVAACFLTFISLGGCGKKGPLTLPEQTQTHTNADGKQSAQQALNLSVKPNPTNQ